MGEISNSFKTALGNQFASKNLYTDSEGFQAYQDFKNSMPEGEMSEKWSEKYKRSIDCNNPKGFSQKAHCQGRQKRKMEEEKLVGGIADKKTFKDLTKKYSEHSKDFIQLEKALKSQLNKGIKVEMEHTDDKSKAKEIALDHLFEDPKYYDKLKKVESREATGAASAGAFTGPLMFKKEETKEATGASSAGSYVTPAAWANSMTKKDWRGKSKTQIPGGKFVTIKKRCKKFPYCNQGDIKALKIYENETVKRVIDKISREQKISKNTIKAIIELELEKNNNKLIK